MSKKFQPIPNHPIWTEEQTNERIAFVQSEINAFQQDINRINSSVSGLVEERAIIRRKISNKEKYINQLKSMKKNDASN